MKKLDSKLTMFDIVTGLLMAAAAGMVFFYAPIEIVMGYVQKVFYFHVASAWVGMLSFIVAAVAGVIYLKKRSGIWDIVSYAAVEIGILFALITIITGSIWARPIWNTWWTWDPRLTTTTIMALVYVAYLMLRQGIDDPEKRARFGAVYVIIGALSVPLTFLSIRIFRTIHPVVIAAPTATSAAFEMAPKMLQTFLFSLFVFSVFFVDLLWHRIKLGKLEAEVEHLKMDAGE
ncbi:MAG: cytochrome C assembly protein [Anaerolinea sp.]|nr:cytochrome C assembly protein [Anaerolinea sp.]